MAAQFVEKALKAESFYSKQSFQFNLTSKDKGLISGVSGNAARDPQSLENRKEAKSVAGPESCLITIDF